MAERSSTSYGHEHRFSFQQKSEFQQTLFKDPNEPTVPLYKRVDFVVACCTTCGHGQKVRVVEVDTLTEE